jgi:poly [ADP-ribose] polymerase
MVKSFKIGDFRAPKFATDYKVIDQVVLNCTNIQGNNNKFYSMELQKSNGDYRIYTHYGRVGDCGVKEGRYVIKSEVKPKKKQTLDEAAKQAALNEYQKILKSKQKKGYHVVEIEAADVGSAKAKVKTTSVKCSSLDERVQSLVEQIYNEASASLTSAIRTPLGALSLSQIEKGYDKLEQIRKAIKSRRRKKLAELTSEFYSLIPQRFSGRIDPDEAIINTNDKADRREELLQLMKDVYNVKDELESGIVKKYRAINAEIRPIDPSDSEYQRLEKKVRKTQSPYHNVNLHINRIYKIGLNTTKGRFNPRRLQTMELFHGSANKNILGIMQRGLLIAPPCANFTGAAFGRGIYFARHSTKSSQYSTKFYRNNFSNGFLFIADVAVGKMEKVRYYTFNSNGASRGYDSVMGVAGADLIHDEFIVYNVNQAELRYLIDFTPRRR